MDPFARKMWRFSLTFAFGMLVAFLALSVVYFHVRPRCSDRVVSSVDSPDHQWIATAMERRCGEEAAFFTHVNLRPAAQPEHYGFFTGRVDEGEIFVVEQDALTSSVSLRWTTPGQLVVECPRCAASLVRKRAAIQSNVQISYVLASR